MYVVEGYKSKIKEDIVMRNKKVNIRVGYSKSGHIANDYKHWERKNLTGTDVEIIDGKGNKIIIGSREDGTLIQINDEIQNLTRQV